MVNTICQTIRIIKLDFWYNVQARKDPKKQLGTSETAGHFSPLDITAIREVYKCRFPSQPEATAAPPASGKPYDK